MPVDYFGGRKWNDGDDISGAPGLANANQGIDQGIVSSLDALGLFIEIEPIEYLDDTGTLKVFVGTLGTPLAVPGNEAAVFVFLDNTNTIVINTIGFPAVSNFFVALAKIVTSVTNVLQIINMQQISTSVSGPGVQTLTVVSPVLNTGTALNPIIDMQPATAGQDGHATAPQITKLDGIEALADVTDNANVEAADAIMDSDITANGNLITKALGVIANIVPGLAGTVLTSLGVGVPPTFQASTGFTPQILFIESLQATAPGPGPLSYNAYEWNTIFSVGAINVDGTDPELINLPTVGKYLFIAMNPAFLQSPSGVAISWNSPPNPAVVVGQGVNFPETPGNSLKHVTTIGGLNGSGQLALQTHSNVGATAGYHGDRFQNRAFIIKVAN